MSVRWSLTIRLAWWSIRAGTARSVLMVVSLGVGVALLLVALAVPGAAGSRQEREIRMTPIALSVGADAPPSHLLWHQIPGEFLGRELVLAALASVGPHPPTPPGLRRPPRPGEIAASPALAELLSSPEGSLLRQRLPGRVEAIIDPDGLPSPDALIGYVGVRAAWLVEPQVVIGFGPRIDTFVRPIDLGLVAIVAVLVLGVLGPIGSLIMAATRLSVRSREARLAALRLIGAEVGRLKGALALEAGALALLGGAAGVPIYLGIRSVASRLLPDPFRWFPGDLSLPPSIVVVIVVGVSCAAILVSFASIRRVALTPLGAVRRLAPRRGRPVWVWLLCGGLGLLLLTFVLASAAPAVGKLALMLGLGAIVLGVLLAVPALTGAVASWLARRAPLPGLTLGACAAAAEPGVVGRAAGLGAAIILLGGMGQAFILASEPSDLTVTLRATAAEPNTMFVSVWNPDARIPRVLRAVDGVQGVERRPTTITGATGGRELQNFAVRTDGAEVTEERIENALAFVGSLVQVDGATDARRRWLEPWLRVRRVAEGAVAAALLVAWVAIVVTSADRAIEQRQVMAALSATGVQRRTLRRAVMVQVMIPLAVAVALGSVLLTPVTALVFAAAGDRLMLPVRYAGWLGVIVVALTMATAALTLPLVRGLVTPSALRAG